MHTAKQPDVVNELVDFLLVFRRDGYKVFPQSSQIAVKACRLALIRYVEERVAAGDAHAIIERADFAPEAVELRLFRRTGQPVHAAFKQVAFSPPAGGSAAGNAVAFVNCRFKPALPCVNTRSETGDSRADDDNLSHNFLHFILSIDCYS